MQMQVNISIYLNKYTFHDLLATDANFARVVKGKRKTSLRVNDFDLSISQFSLQFRKTLSSSGMDTLQTPNTSPTPVQPLSSRTP